MSSRLRNGVLATLLVLQMRQTLSLAASGLATRTLDHLEPAEQAAVLGADLIQNGTVPLDDDIALLSYLDAQVRAAPDITGAYVGRPDGSFVLVSRDGAEVEGGTRVKSIRFGPDGERISSTVQRDDREVVVDGAEDPTDTFDPRTRPWYEQAVLAAGAPAWTEPYVFFASREPGVTVSVESRTDGGELLAVVGVDLSLRNLSQFVSTVTVVPGSRAALVDTDRMMVAASEVDQAVVDDGQGGLRRASVKEVTDLALAGAAETAVPGPDGEASRPTTVGGAEVAPFSVDGEAWQVATTPLQEREPWLAAVAAPEDEFVSEVVDAQRRNALLAVAIGLGVVVLSFPLVNRFVRRLERAQERASTDALTGLPNRRRFDELLAEHLADRQGRPLCVAMIDVDLFKHVNDALGHGAGDEVLAAVAGRLRASVRDGDVVARIGGDEFAALLVDAPLDLAAEVLERARASVGDEPAGTNKGPVPMSVTIGVAPVDGSVGADEALESADAALYVAKAAGRNRVATPDGVRSPAGSPPRPVV